MQLLVISKGRRQLVPTKALLPGTQGNLQTIVVIVPMVRRDAVEDLEVRRLALDLVADCPNEFECQVGKLFEYARSIRFARDPIDAERVADAATTIAEQSGDCADKSILLASLLGSIGWVSRFVALNFYDDLESHGFDHLLIEAQRDDGSWVPLDATPEAAPVGWEPEAPVRRVFEIWPEAEQTANSKQQTAGMGGLFDDLIGQGIQLGTQVIAGAVQRSRVSSEQAAQIGAQFDQLAGQVTQLFNQIQSQSVITQADLEAAIAGYTQLAQAAQQYANVDYVVQQWNLPSYKAAYEERLRQMAAVAQQTAVGNQQSDGVLSSVLPASVAAAFSNPLAIVAVGLLALALVVRSK